MTRTVPTPQRLLLTGATGMVGGLVLRQALSMGPFRNQALIDAIEQALADLNEA